MTKSPKGRNNKKIYIIAACAAAAVALIAAVSIIGYSMFRKDDVKPTANAVTTAAATSAATSTKSTTAAQTTTAEKTTAAKTTSAPKTAAKTEGGNAGNTSSGYTDALNNYLSQFSSVPQSGTINKTAEAMTIGYQILVNNKYAYNTEQKQDIMTMTSLNNRAFTVAYTDLDADRFTLQQFNSMNRTYYSKYGEKLNVCSGYRSYQSQKRLFDNSVAKNGEEETLKWYTRPGHSEHHTGFAIDYNTNSFGSSAFTGTGDEAWVKNNCDDYGFILRYTADKKPITGVAAEAWHFRQVGIPHAKYIMSNDLCLEEYIDEIKGYSYDKPLSVKTAKGEYTFYVWYVPLGKNDNTDISLSGYSKYTVSGNNVDGFIVTAIK